MKCFYSLLLLFFAVIADAQDIKKTNNDIILKEVVHLFNKKLTDSIYMLFNEPFKKAVAYPIFRNVSETEMYPLGKIRKTTFEKFESGISMYKAELDSANLALFISADSLGKLSAYGFKPYKPPYPEIRNRKLSDNSMKTFLSKKVDSIIQPFMLATKTVALSVGVFHNGKFHYYNYGETKKGNDTLPTSESIYEIGSITKTFTGLLLANAVVDGKINLQDPVNKYLPEDIPDLKFENDTMRVVHLSNHTSGLPRMPVNMLFADPKDPYKNYDTQNLYAFLKHVKLLSKPGETFLYSNLGVGLLGVLLENVYKEPLENLMKVYIIQKAGMKHTTQTLSDSDKNLFLPGYNRNGEQVPAWEFKALAGAGALRSNTKDLLLYAKYNMSIPKDLKEQRALKISQTETYQKDKQRVALNWFLQNRGNGYVLFHDGQTGGYKSFLAINQRTKNAVVLLSNNEASHDEEGINLLNYLDRN